MIVASSAARFSTIVLVPIVGLTAISGIYQISTTSIVIIAADLVVSCDHRSLIAAAATINRFEVVTVTTLAAREVLTAASCNVATTTYIGTRTCLTTSCS